MKILCVFGKHNYGQSSRGTSIEYTAFVPALTRLGHTVLHFDSWEKHRFTSYRQLNEELLKTVADARPDAVFTVQRDYEIWTETLAEMKRRSNVRLITWTTDDSWKFREVSRFIAPYYDVVATTYDYSVPQYRKQGIMGVHLTQWAASTDWLLAPRLASTCKYGVTFVGTAYGNRRRLVEALRGAGVSVTCFGHGWKGGAVCERDIPKIFNESRISLNFSAGSKGGAHKPQLKARVFEVPGSGGFLLTERTPGLETYYRIGQEVATFDDSSGLIERCRYFLREDSARDTMAVAAYNRTTREHTYEARLERLLQFAFSRKASSVPLSRQKGKHPEFTEVAQSHELGRVLTALGTALRLGGVSLWGSDKGVRAARRLTFEVCWRILRGHTFSAAGIPGRLFPNI